MQIDLADLTKVMESAALAAGRAIMTIHSGGTAVQYKPDSSPVTEADEEAERLILAALKQHFPTIPIVAEEAVAAGDIPAVSYTHLTLPTICSV